MTFGQILDRIYRLMRQNLRLFLSIAAVPSAAIVVVIVPVLAVVFVTLGPQLASKAATPPAAFSLLPLTFVLPAELIVALVFVLYLPAATYVTTHADAGLTATFRDAYSAAWRRFGRYLWLMVLTVLYVLVPIFVAALAVAVAAFLSSRASAGSSAPLIMVPLFLVLYLAIFVYSVLITLRFSLAFPASVVEGLGAWPSLQRSASLTKGARGRIFLVLLIVYAVTYIVNLIILAVFFVIGAIGFGVAVLAHVTQGSSAFYVLIGLAGLCYVLVLVACSMFAYAVYPAALAVIYHDQRRRKDTPLPAPPQAGELA
jgi:hypothetical protein